MVEETERSKAIAWMAGSVLAGALVAMLCLAFAFPLYKLVNPLHFADPRWPELLVLNDPSWRPGFSLRWLDDTAAFLSVGLVFHFDAWREPLWALLVAQPLETTGLPHWTVALSGLAGIVAAAALAEKCPWEIHRKSHGEARFATHKDLRKAGLYSPTGMILGKVGKTYIRMPETLSAILIAPPGSGKTAGIVLPNLLAEWPEYERVLGSEWLGRMARRKTFAPRPSFIVNDPKGELFKKAGPVLRAKGYNVRKLAWADTDGNKWNPISPDSLPGGRAFGQTRHRVLERLDRIYTDPLEALTQITVQARDKTAWLRQLAEDMTLGGRLALTDEILKADREAMEQGEAQELPSRAALKEILPDIKQLFAWMSQREAYVRRLWTIAVSQKIEPHWRDKGRAAGQGLTLFTIYRCEHDPEKWGEASFGRLHDFLTEATKGFDAAAAGGGEDNDAVAQMLADWIEEAERCGYPGRVITELAALARTPSRERGSILSTMEGGIDIFKMQTVRASTATSDFSLDEIRFGDRPTALFIVVPLEDAVSLAPITGMLFEASAARFISQDEQEIKKRGRPIFYVADEFWTLPEGMESFLQIPALGRGQWVQLLLVGQSYGQIALKINKEAVGILKGATASQIILQQNDQETAESVQKMVGNYTALTSNVSQQHGMGKEVKLFQWNTSKSATGLPLLPAQRLMTMTKIKEQYTLFQGMMSRPIKCSTPVYFKDRNIMAAMKKAGVPEPNRADQEMFEHAAREALLRAQEEERRRIEQTNRALGPVPEDAEPPQERSAWKGVEGDTETDSGTGTSLAA